MKNKYLVILTAFIFVWLACNNKQKRIINRDTSINQKTSFNNLFVDSVEVENFLAGHSEFKKFEDQYLDFYKQRNYEYAWFDKSGLAEQSHNFINLLNSTINDLQDSSLYNAPLFGLYEALEKDAKEHKKKIDIEQTELLFTGQFFAYAAKVYKGSDIDATELGWYIPRKKISLSALLDSSLKSKAKGSDKYVPLNTQYKQLQEYLVKYFELDKQTAGVWDSIPYTAKLLLKKGDSSHIIAQLKNRLQLLGDITIADTSGKFDSTLFVATKKFQRRMGLSIDGVIGARMIQELNVPIKQRIQQLLVNMERVRWMPPEKDTNYIMVNIPEYKMHVYDSGKLMFDMNVIVGKASNNTVIFNGNLKFIVFSPYWNVPPSIVQKEIVPALKHDKNYLQRNNMEITGTSNGLPVVRQKPGTNNSLGLVKFLFPNNYDIYLHDTPNHELFNVSSRSFSHGCIRISEPKKFAQYLLRADTATTWKSNVIDSSMHLPKERWVTLKKTIPVFIVYFTAWVDKNGLLNFRKDIYGHDEKMSEKLFVNKYFILLTSFCFSWRQLLRRTLVQLFFIQHNFIIMSRIKFYLLFNFILFSCSVFSQNDTCLVKIFFPFDKYELNDSSKELLKNFSKFFPLQANLKIIGRTDCIGTDAYNDKLSLKRAQSVFQFLLKNNIDSNRISKVIGIGKHELIKMTGVNSKTEDQLNRVVSIINLGIVKQQKIIPDSTVNKPVVEIKENVENDKPAKSFQDQLNNGVSTIILNNLNFEKGRHVLLIGSYPALREVIEAMKYNLTLELEIQGHICCLDSSEIDAIDIDTNEKALSTNRAKAVYEYLITCGIKSNRISYKGFGAKKKLIFPEIKETDAIMNRRVEFKIIKK